MPRSLSVLGIALAVACGVAADDPKKPAEAKKPAGPPPAAKPAAPAGDVGEKAKVSEGMGLNFARNLVGLFGADAIDAKAFQKGFEDGLAGKGTMTHEEIVAMTSVYKWGLEHAEQKKHLDENRKKPGVKVTASGLQYEVLKAGTGTKSPAATDTVKVHYAGTLVNGTPFDSTIERNEPAERSVSEFIVGWQEALQLMKAGDKWRLVIPSYLAYKEQQKGDKIPPGSTLVFELELLEIK